MKKLILFCVIALMFAANSYAQNDREDFKQKLNQVRKEKFIERVKVDDATADKYFQVTDVFLKQIKDLNQSQKTLVKSMKDNPNASDIESKLNQYIDNESKIGNTKTEYYQNLRTFLSTTQVAQAIVFQREFMKKLKDEVDKRKGKKKRKRD